MKESVAGNIRRKKLENRFFIKIILKNFSVKVYIYIYKYIYIYTYIYIYIFLTWKNDVVISILR